MIIELEGTRRVRADVKSILKVANEVLNNKRKWLYGRELVTKYKE
jgi:hypothetical protein